MANAQQCPRNIKNCKGLCGWFTDQDRDGYCDLTVNISEIMYNRKVSDSLSKIREAEAQRKADSTAAAENKVQQTETKDQQQTVEPDCRKTCPHAGTDTEIPCRKNDTVSTEQDAIEAEAPIVITDDNQPTGKYYDLYWIFGGCLVAYLLTWFLSRKNLLKKATHRKIWNVLLLITFLVTGLIGLFLVVQLNYKIGFTWFSDLLYWHVQFGIAMAAISIFHLLWHMRYWLNIFKSGRKNDSPCQ